MSHSRVIRTSVQAGILVSVVALTCGCVVLGEEVTPAQRALEIVFEGEDEACTVNFADVGAGNHAVSVIAGDITATVRILNGNGSVLYRTKAEPGAEQVPAEGDDEAVAVPESDSSVELAPGRYEIKCEVGGSTSTVPLLVTE